MISPSRDRRMILMKTVKEVSQLTGISVRTFHYYDEIGLFKPTKVTEAGYRLYDDEAIDKLGQILVFRELDLPLADIKLIMDNPDLDHNSVLAKQREMLLLKKQRLERIIANLDGMLRGDHEMNFTVFDEAELQAMFSDMLQNMNESQKQIFIDHYGSIEAWEQHMIEGAFDEKIQKNYAKVVEWYGSKDAVKESLKNPPKSEVFAAYQKRIGDIQKKLADMRGADVNSFAVRQLIGEYDFVAKQLYQVKDAKPLLMDIAREYRENEDLAKGMDSVYGSGSAKYMGDAIEAFYTRPGFFE
jgi:DNA-binding transcriptional MerR regulator